MNLLLLRRRPHSADASKSILVRTVLGTHILLYYFYEENVPLARAAAIRKACGTPQRRRVAAPVSSAHHSLMSLDTIVHSYIRVNDELPNHEADFFIIINMIKLVRYSVT